MSIRHKIVDIICFLPCFLDTLTRRNVKTCLDVFWREEVVAEVSPERGGEEVGHTQGQEGQADLGDGEVELLKVVLQARFQQTL